MVKDLLCNAGDVGSVPDGGTKIRGAVEQLAVLTAGSGHLRACQPQRLHLRSTTRVHALQGLPGAATKTQRSQINITKN